MNYPQVKTRPTRDARTGDRLGSLEVVDAAGHTPGQVASHDTRDLTLLCADVYATLFEPVTSAKPTLRSPMPAIATWHRPTALASAHRCGRSSRRASRRGTGAWSSAPRRSWTQALATVE